MQNEKNRDKEAPKETIGRLPLYLRRLEHFQKQGKEWVTSREFVEKLPGIRSSKLRKDLSYFGDFGTQGRGYNVSRFITSLEEVLDLDSRRRAALVGVGRLGTALLNYPGFDRWGFDLCLAFDRDPEIIGSQVGGIKVDSSEEMKEKLEASRIDIGIIAVPGDQAQPVADDLVSGGVKGIVNFSPVLLDTTRDVRVTKVDITSILEALTFYC